MVEISDFTIVLCKIKCIFCIFLRGTPGCSGVQEGSLSLFLQAKPDSPGEKGEVPAESHRLFFVRQTLRPRATFDPSQAARQVGVPQGPGNEPR